MALRCARAHPPPSRRRRNCELAGLKFPQVNRSLQLRRQPVRPRQELRTRIVAAHDHQTHDRHAGRNTSGSQAPPGRAAAAARTRCGTIRPRRRAIPFDPGRVSPDTRAAAREHAGSDCRGSVSPRWQSGRGASLRSQADDVHRAPRAGHLDLPIKTAHVGRAIVFPEAGPIPRSPRARRTSRALPHQRRTVPLRRRPRNRR